MFPGCTDHSEDGTVQGLLELANVPYVGAGVMASAVGMDKAAMKVLFAARGLPIAAWTAFTAADWRRDTAQVSARALALGLPLFVKPANLGSSVGISKVKNEAGLAPAIALAVEFDRKIVVEAGVGGGRGRSSARVVLGTTIPKRRSPRDHPVARVLRLRTKYLTRRRKR